MKRIINIFKNLLESTQKFKSRTVKYKFNINSKHMVNSHEIKKCSRNTIRKAKYFRGRIGKGYDYRESPIKKDKW